MRCSMFLNQRETEIWNAPSLPNFASIVSCAAARFLVLRWAQPTLWGAMSEVSRPCSKAVN